MPDYTFETGDTAWALVARRPYRVESTTMSSEAAPINDAPTGPLDRVRAFAVPVVMVCVAAFQLTRVHFDGQTSWRGGGFGMYAGFHPSYNDAWLVRETTGEALRYTQAQNEKLVPDRALIRPVLPHPNARNLHRALDRLPPEWRTGVRLEVWQLDFDPRTLRLTRRRLAEASRPVKEAQ
jgi:hypothetical protein